MAATSQNGSPRVLVLGSDGYGRGVVAHRWDKLPNGLNVADYEVVILDLASAAEGGLAGSVVERTLPDIEQFVRLSYSGGIIYAIGNPSIQLTGQLDGGWWLPIDMEVIHESGEVVEHEPGWQFWFERNRGFTWCLRAGYIVRLPWLAGHSHAECRCETAALASTRYGVPLAFEMTVWGESFRATTSYLLPLPSGLSSHEAVSLLLREKAGIDLIAQPPPWIASYKLPDEASADSRLREAVQAVGAAQAAEAQASEQLEREQRFRALLYATGDELENIVHDALRTLGATVERPSGDKDDGRLLDPKGRSGMLEVKGVKGQIGVEHVRQLRGWALDAEATGWEGKPILVGNVLRDKPPSERGNPVADNAAKFATKQGVVIVTTAQIYEVLRKLQLGADSLDFWDALFGNVGESDLPPITPTTD